MKALKLAAAGAAVRSSWSAHAGATFDSIKNKGFVQCGVSTGVSGLSANDSKGDWVGLDVDLCRAIAITLFGDASKAKILSISALQRFTALQSGEVDVLTRNTTLADARHHAGPDRRGRELLRQPGHHGEQVPERQKRQGAGRRHGLRAARHHHRAEPGRLVRSQGIAFKPSWSSAWTRSSARSPWAAATPSPATNPNWPPRSTLANPDQYVILPENFSKEPLGPMVRQGDEQWFNIVRWTMYAMMEAEEYGITSKNVDEMLKSTNPNVQRLLGVTPGMGKNLGVDDKWAYNVIKRIGNYGESYEKTWASSPLKLPRGLNASYRDGGLIYGWPVR